MKLKKIALPLAIVFSLALLYWPTCRWLVQSWVSNSYYAHGFIIPLISGFLVWTKRHELEKGEPSIIGAFVLAAGAAMYILGFFWDMRFLSAFSLLIVLSGLTLFFYGTNHCNSVHSFLAHGDGDLRCFEQSTINCSCGYSLFSLKWFKPRKWDLANECDSCNSVIVNTDGCWCDAASFF